MTTYRMALTVAFTSFATLVFQLTQTRILSYIFWNHAVYLTVSLALLGFGISGTFVALFASTKQLCSPRVLARLLTGFGVSSVGAIALTAWLLPHLGWEPAWRSLLFCYVLYVAPFVCAGAILGIILSSAVAQVGSLYSIDLLAAGLGCLLFFFLLPLLSAPILVCVLSAFSLLLAAVWSERQDPVARVTSLLGAVGLAAVALVQGTFPSFLDFTPVPHKEMGTFMDQTKHPHARIEHTTWTPIGRIDVVGDEQANLWGYQHPRGSYKIITQDGTAHTRVLSKRAIEALGAEVKHGTNRDPESLVFRIKPDADVAIVGVGGGIDVAKALAFGARSVYGVELNPATYRYATEVYAEYSGHLLHDPRVTLVNGEGRSTLRALDRRFDVIQFIAVDTFAALDAGAYVLSENYLYTVEAFEDMFDRLKPDGVLVFYRWLFYPPRETLRLSALACEAWARRGADECSRRIMVIGAGDWALSLFKPLPFTPEEAETLGRHAASIGKTVLHWPKVFAPADQERLEAAHYDRVEPRIIEAARAFNGLTAAYRGGGARPFFQSYVYNVTPTTDDSPFFFEYHFLNAVGLPRWSGGHTDHFRGGTVATTLYLVLAEATLLSLVAIFWPLYRYQRAGLRVPHAAAYSLYFAALGFGFMMIEIGLTQKAVLFLGNPLYALSVVLATLLASAGIGSRVVARNAWSVRRVTGPVAVLFLALVALLIVGLTPLFQACLHLPFLLRVGVIVLVMAPPGVLMGMFFPSGLRSVGEQSSGFIPWAWGINGCMSVYGSVVAILAAMVYGFTVALTAGAAVYACGFLAARGFSREPPTGPHP
ncbi:MAG TPA: class I SAM-dependent methyltransferase [Candidatus Tectomicrobia bacterium]|jgi:predicted membrane-bound spermidine synthase|nr:class I SAM-dependent methyltransferase [Candidatus Tectomicrobia bacterium]